MNYGIDIYTSETTANEIGIEGYGVHYLESGKQYEIGTLLIIPFDLVHFHNDGSECKNFGYLIYSKVTKEKLLFATDTAYIHNRFKGLTHILIETNYISDFASNEQISAVEKRRYMSHQCLETAIEFLQATDLSKVNEIYAIHLSHDKTDKNVIKQRLQEITGKLVIVC